MQKVQDVRRMTPEALRRSSRTWVAGGFQGKGRRSGLPHPHHQLPQLWLQLVSSMLGPAKLRGYGCLHPDFRGAAHAQPRQRATLSTGPPQRAPTMSMPADSQEHGALRPPQGPPARPWGATSCPLFPQRIWFRRGSDSVA